MTYTDLSEIRARVTTSWNHHNCKFRKGDRVRVNKRVLPSVFKGRVLPGCFTSKPQQSRFDQTGTVVAVSCVADGTIRGTGNRRQFTRYYIQFFDQQIQGFESHHLDVAWNNQTTHNHMMEQQLRKLADQMIADMKLDLTQDGDLHSFSEQNIRIAVFEDLKDTLKLIFADVANLWSGNYFSYSRNYFVSTSCIQLSFRLNIQSWN